MMVDSFHHRSVQVMWDWGKGKEKGGWMERRGLSHEYLLLLMHSRTHNVSNHTRQLSRTCTLQTSIVSIS